MITKAEIERLLGPWQCQLGSVFMWWSTCDRYYAECHGPLGGIVAVGECGNPRSVKRVATFDDLRAELERTRWWGEENREVQS